MYLALRLSANFSFFLFWLQLYCLLRIC
uniref:Uncharacterized protein n=1 Tax=Heterorhabditis bacteriophora TaxID=37862 RepID=A0A1I7XEM9_HETBA